MVRESIGASRDETRNQEATPQVRLSTKQK